MGDNSEALRIENEQLRHLLKRSRIHIDSLARRAKKDAQPIMGESLIALAYEIRVAIGEPLR
jgi:hypothetical protein